MRIGIVADDLTGAMDSAVAFADRGLGTAVLLDAGAPHGRSAAVLSIDTHSRDLPPQEAAERVRAAAALVLAQERLPFKKIDSTLRGNLAAEIAAALHASGRRLAIVAPSAPAQRRVLRGGRLFVDGEQAATAPLAERLASELPALEVCRLAPGDSHRAGDLPRVYVADAEDDDELDRIAAIGLDDPRDVLLVGSSGLSSALARTVCRFPDAVVRPDRARAQRLWFVVGSYHARSAQQVRALLDRGDVQTLVLPLAEAQPAFSEPPGRLALVQVEGLGGPPVADPRRIAARLAEVAAGMLGERPVPGTALFITGGDTARAILSRLRVHAIEVLGSAAPGVVHGAVTVGGTRVAVVTKAGGFGEPDLFVQLARELLA